MCDILTWTPKKTGASLLTVRLLVSSIPYNQHFFVNVCLPLTRPAYADSSSSFFPLVMTT